MRLFEIRVDERNIWWPSYVITFEIVALHGERRMERIFMVTSLQKMQNEINIWLEKQ